MSDTIREVGDGTRHEDVICTGLLIQQGSARVVEAYMQEIYKGREVWRMRDDKYDPPGTEYTRVTVEQSE